MQWGGAALGLILGPLAWYTAVNLALRISPRLDSALLLAAAAVVAALLLLTRLRPLIWLFAGGTAALLLLVGCTPILQKPVLAWVRTDPIRHCPAVVVLSSGVREDGTLDEAGQERLLGGLELLQQGFAHELVITRIRDPDRSSLPFVRQEMADLRIKAPVVEVGPVMNTHDEALATARLAHMRGWKRILLVTGPLHSRRAGATFAHTGLDVVVRPCVEGGFDLPHLEMPTERVAAFRQWLKEVVGLWVYHRRGWT